MDILQKYPKRSRNSASRVVDGEAVVVQPLQSEINVLNEVGTRIWELADGSRSLDLIIHDIQEEFDAAPEVIRKDVCYFVEELNRKKMITLEGANGEHGY